MTASMTQGTQVPQAAAAPPPGPPVVDFQQVSITYGGPKPYTAVENVNLTIQPGEFVAVVGPSGCGKSTLIRLVAGLMGASSGHARVLGTERAHPGEVGIAFQNASLLPWRSVLQNVLLPLEVAPQHKASYRRDPAPYVARAQELLHSVGLDHAVHKSPWELSGGMQQRVNLCRALIHSPSILLLDEPFGALDAFTREELWVALQDVWLERQPTVLLITHDLREAVMLADTVYIMGGRPGQIMAAQHIDLPRPRTLESTFDEAFVHYVKELREAVGDQRPRGSVRLGSGAATATGGTS